ncbi:hypothetical protein [Halorussus halophilus]|nr:hypothetical protein [Halorussus halophilus]
MSDGFENRGEWWRLAEVAVPNADERPRRSRQVEILPAKRW